MADTSKNIIIGVFVLAAIVLLVWLVLFIHPSPGDESQRLRVRFTNIEKIQEGTRVTFAGQPVGKVEKIIDHFNGEADPRESAGPMYFFDLILAIDSGVYVYDTDEVTIKMTGLFGERNVAILPRRPPKGVTPVRVTGDSVIYAKSQDAVDEALGELVDVATKMGTTFDKLSELIDTNADDLHEAVLTFKDSMGEFGETFKSVNESDMIGSIQSAFEGIGIVMEVIEGDLRELEEEGVWENAGTMMSELANAATNVNDVTRNVAEGRGTVGELLSSDDLYLDLRSMLGKVDTLLNDVNHYGVLFHQNRRWQRERTKRANLLAAIKSPKAFRCYFDQEIDQISTSLARVTLLLEEARCSCRGRELICNPCFVKEFATLLRHVECLQQQLDFYNQTLVDNAPCR